MQLAAQFLHYPFNFSFKFLALFERVSDLRVVFGHGERMQQSNRFPSFEVLMLSQELV
jgi:hypothetical protein